MMRNLSTLNKSFLILFLMIISACSSIGPANKLTFFQMADTQFGFFNANKEFNSIMADKMAAALDAKKIEVASGMIQRNTAEKETEV